VLRTRFLESDRLKALEVPEDDRLQASAESIASPCKVVRPRPFDRHVRSFYRLHLVSTWFGRPGCVYLQPARFESAKAVRLLNCSETTIPKPYSSVSGCGPPSGNKSPPSARSSALSVMSSAITSTASVSGGASRGIHAAFTGALLRSITTHAALR